MIPLLWCQSLGKCRNNFLEFLFSRMSWLYFYTCKTYKKMVLCSIFLKKLTVNFVNIFVLFFDRSFYKIGKDNFLKLLYKNHTSIEGKKWVHKDTFIKLCNLYLSKEVIDTYEENTFNLNETVHGAYYNSINKLENNTKGIG